MKRVLREKSSKRDRYFENIVMMSQERLKAHCRKRLNKKGGYVSVGDGYVFRKGTFPVLLCAHLDRYQEHKSLAPYGKPVETIVYANGTISSPQGICGDDRCGVYAIFKILEKYDCSVVFLEDEETGCNGARLFARSNDILKVDSKLKFILEFDRKGRNDFVTYDCENEEFNKFIADLGYFEKAYGTCSDISYIAPELDVAAANLSCGYYNEHHLKEHVVLKEMYDMIENAINILEASKEVEIPFDFVEKKRSWSRGGYYSNYSWDDDYYYYSSNKKKKEDYLFGYRNSEGVLKQIMVTKVDSKIEAYYEFFKKYKTVCMEDVVSCERFL